MKLSDERRTSQAIIQHLKATGIKIRRWKACGGEQQQEKVPRPGSGLFGVPLHLLPLSERDGPIPQFLVDACHFLSPYLHTEGLFRKSGSMTRIKALKVRLESGERCLNSALPCDVAALLKQFFRDLPDPLIPVELQEPLYRIQEVVSERERGSITALVTCLLPRIRACTLRYLCTFLQRIAIRCDENKMDSGNLALVLAPNLFASSEQSERLTVGTEKQLQLQVAVLETLITSALEIGHVPEFITAKLSSVQDTETICCTSVSQDKHENVESDGSCQRRRRRSMGDIVNGALSRWKTGHTASSASQKEQKPAAEMDSGPVLRTSFKTKRKASEDSCEGSELKKRKATLDFSPGQLVSDDTLGLSGTSPADAALVGLPDVFPDAELGPGCFQSSAALCAPDTPRSSASVRRQRSKRDGKCVQRVPSGRSGCFPPSVVDRTDRVRKSLRLFRRTRSEKEESGASLTLETSGWTLMKNMVADALEGPLFSEKDPQLIQSSLKTNDQGHGSPNLASTEEILSEASPNCEELFTVSSPRSPSHGASALDTQAKCGTISASCETPAIELLTLDTSPGQNPDAQGHGESVAVIQDIVEGSVVPHSDSLLEWASESPKKQYRVLRRSISLPENLLESLDKISLETGHKLESGSAAENMSEASLYLNGQQLCANADMVPRVDSALQLGLPLVLVTLADEGVGTLVSSCLQNSIAASSELSEESTQARIRTSTNVQEPLGLYVSVADCIRKLKPSKSIAPKRSMHRIAMNLQRVLGTALEGPPERNLFPLQRRGARKFGRSLSHESGLAMETSMGGVAAGPSTPPLLREQDVDCLKARSSLSPQLPKSPLKSLKTYSRQIFISKKHITLSFAGLRNKKEVGSETSTFPAPRSAQLLPEILSEKAVSTAPQELFPQESPLQHCVERASALQTSLHPQEGHEEIQCH
uniref:Rho GTPase-activating protein 11A-like n=1 Tax=Geotrypetes seraphini TaxID=260995 RepID=A0A6P8RVY9_GEOSA|nr:rho GTPase-activating protein 11A-like [Geotrypetes seraphini]